MHTENDIRWGDFAETPEQAITLTLAAKLALSCALILPQSVLLGATFPLMSAGLARAHPDSPGESVAMLYFTNSLGAAAGVLPALRSPLTSSEKLIIIGASTGGTPMSPR